MDETSSVLSVYTAYWHQLLNRLLNEFPVIVRDLSLFSCSLIQVTPSEGLSHTREAAVQFLSFCDPQKAVDRGKNWTSGYDVDKPRHYCGSLALC